MLIVCEASDTEVRESFYFPMRAVLLFVGILFVSSIT
jgi:hypothetical protein